eukprot:4644709-Prymnesium_polylepis.1
MERQRRRERASGGGRRESVAGAERMIWSPRALAAPGRRRVTWPCARRHARARGRGAARAHCARRRTQKHQIRHHGWRAAGGGSIVRGASSVHGWRGVWRRVWRPWCGGRGVAKKAAAHMVPPIAIPTSDSRGSHHTSPFAAVRQAMWPGVSGGEGGADGRLCCTA